MPIRPLSAAGAVLISARVLRVDVWAFECWNCYRSFPWLHPLEQRLAGQDFCVIGIHSPELESECLREVLQAL